MFKLTEEQQQRIKFLSEHYDEQTLFKKAKEEAVEYVAALYEGTPTDFVDEAADVIITVLQQINKRNLIREVSRRIDYKLDRQYVRMKRGE